MTRRSSSHGSLIPAVNALLLGTLLYKSRLVPRVSSNARAHRSAPLLIVGFIGTMFGAWEAASSATVLLALPIATWEFSLGVYLVVKGFKPSPITAGMTA